MAISKRHLDAALDRAGSIIAGMETMIDRLEDGTDKQAIQSACAEVAKEIADAQRELTDIRQATEKLYDTI